MAYSFGANLNNFLRTATGLRGNGDPRPISFGCRLRCAATTNQQWIFENVVSGDPGFGCVVGSGTSTAVMRCYSGYPSATYTNSATFTNDTNWHSYLWTYATGSPGALVFYRDGAQLTSTTKTYGQNPSVTNSSVLGGLLVDLTFAPTAGFFIDGELADVGVWNVVLDAAESIAYTNGAAPQLIRPSALLAWTLLQNSAVQDLKFGTSIQGGTLTKATTHPRIFYPTSPIIMHGKAGAVAPTVSMPPWMIRRRLICICW